MKVAFKILFFFFLIGCAESSLAQVFKPGIILGVAATDLDGTDLVDYDNDFSKAGFTGGGSLNIKLSEKNSLQFEILYTQKGSLKKHMDSLGNGYYKLNLDYVEIPLMFKHNIVFNINKKRIDNFYFEIGPSYGRLVQVKQEGTFDYAGGYQNNFKNDEFALNIGLGCRLANHLYFDLRYCNSLAPVVNQHSNNFSSSSFWYTFNKGNNMVWAFTLRYVFSKEKEKKEVKEKETDAEN